MTYIDDIPVTPAPRQPDAVTPIGNDGFFPDINMPEMRDAMRLDSTVTNARLRPALVAAMLAINAELSRWQQRQLAQGHTTLDSVPAVQIDGISRNVALYLRAVYCSAKADLFEAYRDYDTTASALTDKKNMEWMDTAPDVQRRNARWAVNDMLGIPRNTVELI
jgi:hypothetical protein